jgi:hypothetical protein
MPGLSAADGHVGPTRPPDLRRTRDLRRGPLHYADHHGDLIVVIDADPGMGVVWSAEGAQERDVLLKPRQGRAVSKDLLNLACVFVLGSHGHHLRGMKRVRDAARLTRGRAAELYWSPHHAPGSGGWQGRKVPTSPTASACTHWLDRGGDQPAPGGLQTLRENFRDPPGDLVSECRVGHAPCPYRSRVEFERLHRASGHGAEGPDGQTAASPEACTTCSLTAKDPLAGCLSGANTHGLVLLQQVVDAVPAVKGPWGARVDRAPVRPSSTWTRPTTIRAGRKVLRAWDHPADCPALASSPASGWGRHRCVMERSLAWLAGCRRLQVRYERRAGILLGCAVWRVR